MQKRFGRIPVPGLTREGSPNNARVSYCQGGRARGRGLGADSETELRRVVGN